MNTNRPEVKLTSVMLDCDNPVILATFYANLLGGSVETNPYIDTWAGVRIPGIPYLPICCQKEECYQPPVWPATDDKSQQMMAHLDFAVTDKEGAIELAVSLGATVAAAQFCPPGWEQPWTTMIDPAGHPFDLTQVKEF